AVVEQPGLLAGRAYGREVFFLSVAVDRLQRGWFDPRVPLRPQSAFAVVLVFGDRLFFDVFARRVVGSEHDLCQTPVEFAPFTGRFSAGRGRRGVLERQRT